MSRPSWGVTTWAAFFVVVGVILAAIFAPIIAPYDPLAVDPGQVLAPPSAAHPAGTDDVGRDILSRIIYGARSSLIGPAMVIVIASSVGTTLAITAAWRGGAFDTTTARAFDIAFALPGLILAIVAAAVFGVGLMAPAIALAIAYIPYIGRVVRSAALRERHMSYIAALEIQGFSGLRICLRHILPNVLPLLVVQSAVAFGYALLDLAAISYVGLGVQPPTPEWGLMVANGQSAILAGHPEQSLFAGLTIVVTVVSVNVLGARFAIATGRGR